MTELYFAFPGLGSRAWWIVGSVNWIDMFWEENGTISKDYGAVWKAYRSKLEKLPAASKLKAVDISTLRPKGEWILEYETYGKMICSLCKTEALLEKKPDPYEYGMTLFYVTSNFCPNCGADMRKEHSDDN